jgi:hypothetical protein
MVLKYLLFFAPLIASADNHANVTTTTTTAPKESKRFDMSATLAMLCPEEERKEWTSSTDQTTGEVAYTQSVNLTARVQDIATGLVNAIDNVADTLDLSDASLTVDKVTDTAISTSRRKLQSQALALAVEYHITVELSAADATNLETTLTTKASDIGLAAKGLIEAELTSAGYTVTGVVQSAVVTATTVTTTTSTTSSATTTGVPSTTSAAFQVVPAVMTVVAVIMGTAF